MHAQAQAAHGQISDELEHGREGVVRRIASRQNQPAREYTTHTHHLPGMTGAHTPQCRRNKTNQLVNEATWTNNTLHKGAATTTARHHFTDSNPDVSVVINHKLCVALCVAGGFNEPSEMRTGRRKLNPWPMLMNQTCRKCRPTFGEL